MKYQVIPLFHGPDYKMSRRCWILSWNWSGKEIDTY